MGFRVRKSFKIAPGVRMTVTPRSIGVSGGVPGARISANSSGRVTRTLGIPGSGISHTKTLSTGSKASTGSRSSAPRQTAAPAVAAPSAPKPGAFAPKWEKVAFKAMTSAPDVAELHRLVQESPKAAELLSLVEVVRVSLPGGDLPRAKALLGWLQARDYEPQSDEFIRKYAPDATLTISIAQGVAATLPLDRNTLGLVLAEIEQGEGNLDQAVAVVEALEPTTIAAVSLAELYADQSRWVDIIDLTNGVSNEDEPSTYLLVQRGKALREQGYFDAARESLKEALRLRSRPAELRNLALVERGKTYLADGKKSLARKDFEKVLADNSGFDGLTELMAATAPGLAQA